ncbi:FAD:protein FMN transferase, partial [bacterium]|nr:FAD:protein FMN transferase [bacterium]
HHLIDPWTGLPAVSDVFSATVIAADVLVAETASKTAVIAGSVNGCDWLDEQKDLAYLLQLDNGKIMTNSLFERYLWSTDGSIHQ